MRGCRINYTLSMRPTTDLKLIQNMIRRIIPKSGYTPIAPRLCRNCHQLSREMLTCRFLLFRLVNFGGVTLPRRRLSVFGWRLFRFYRGFLLPLLSLLQRNGFKVRPILCEPHRAHEGTASGKGNTYTVPGTKRQVLMSVKKTKGTLGQSKGSARPQVHVHHFNIHSCHSDKVLCGRSIVLGCDNFRRGEGQHFG